MDDFATGYMAGQDSGGNSEGFFGNEGLWAVIILAIIFGWGWGGNRNGQGGDGMSALPYIMSAGGLGGADTRAAVSDGFALNGLESGIRGVQDGLCDGFYAVNTSLLQGFGNANTAMLQGFNGVQSQMAALAAQQQSCCCETQRLLERGFCDANYNLATQACEIKQTINGAARDLLDNNNANTRAILDFLTQDKIANLQAENQTLKFAASQAQQNAYIAANQEAQTAELIRRLSPTPVPAYTVPAPYPYCVGNGYNYGCAGCAA